MFPSVMLCVDVDVDVDVDVTSTHGITEGNTHTITKNYMYITLKIVIY
jgi:hypothetical protein